MNRRGFLSGLLAIGVIAGAGMRLPKRVDTEVHDFSPYLTSKDAWFLNTDIPHGLYSNTLSPAADLSEAALEDICRQTLAMGGARIDKLVLHPTHVWRVQRVLANRSTTFQRLWWWLTDAATV